MYVYPRKCTWTPKENMTLVMRETGPRYKRKNIPTTSFARGGDNVAQGNVP